MFSEPKWQASHPLTFTNLRSWHKRWHQQHWNNVLPWPSAFVCLWAESETLLWNSVKNSERSLTSVLSCLLVWGQMGEDVCLVEGFTNLRTVGMIDVESCHGDLRHWSLYGEMEVAVVEWLYSFWSLITLGILCRCIEAIMPGL